MFKNLSKNEILAIVFDGLLTAIGGVVLGCVSASSNKKEIDEQVEKRLAEMQATVEDLEENVIHEI